LNLTEIVRTLGKTVKNNSPLILTAIGVSGVATTAVLAVKATPAALRDLKYHIDYMELEYQDGGPEPKLLTNFDIVKLTWKYYIPATGVGIATIACIIGAQRINTKKNAVLVSAVSLSETLFKEYSTKVVEQVGVNKEQLIRDEIAQDRVNTAKPSSTEQIIISGTDVLCFDTYTGRYFQSNVEAIRKAMNDINQQCFNDMYASQNDFYTKIGLTAVAIGEEVGWNNENTLEVIFSTVLSENNQPCLAVSYRIQPKAGYAKLW